MNLWIHFFFFWWIIACFETNIYFWFCFAYTFLRYFISIGIIFGWFVCLFLVASRVFPCFSFNIFFGLYVCRHLGQPLFETPQLKCIPNIVHWHRTDILERIQWTHISKVELYSDQAPETPISINMHFLFLLP